MTVAERSRSGAKQDLRIDRLDAAEAAEVVSLYEATLARSPDGFLANREDTQLTALLSDGASGLGIGAWVQSADGASRLVAYTLCQKASGTEYPNAPILSGIGSDLWVGRGTVVREDFEGRLLMPRLLAARRKALEAMGVEHTAGLIATTNFASLTAAMRVGACIVGLEHDESCLNFVAYAGALVRGEFAPERQTIDASDTDAARRLIDQRHLGIALNRASQGAARTLDFAQLR